MRKTDKAAALSAREILFIEEAESRTNRDNILCLIVLAAVILLIEGLNELGVFTVVPFVMRCGAAFSIVCYLVPVFILARPLRLFDSGGELHYCRWYKYLILFFAWMGTIAVGVMLTHHAVIAMAVPLMLMAQYRDTKKLVPISIVLATVCVLAGVYGGYYLGCFDGNLLHIGVTEENIFDLALRAQLGTPKRMGELLTHYALPRELVVLALLFLAAKISRRSDEMIHRQAELQSTVQREMQRASDMQWQIIDGMANLIENRDSSTGEHVKRTRYYVASIVKEMQRDPAFQKELEGERGKTVVRAAPLHDIGKIAVADRILQKPGRLTAEEYNEIKLHASEGERIIDNVLGSAEDEGFLRVAREIAGGHHERWDGKGYPKGLAGEDIPLPARIMAVADVFDALVSKRVYKSPVAPEEAFSIIESESGKQFDPEVVKAFLELKPQLLDYLSRDISGISCAAEAG